MCSKDHRISGDRQQPIIEMCKTMNDPIMLARILFNMDVFDGYTMRYNGENLQCPLCYGHGRDGRKIKIVSTDKLKFVITQIDKALNTDCEVSD